MNLNDTLRDSVAALCEMGLIADGEQFGVRALSGGVSCDVYEVRTKKRAFCVKRALPRLRVAAEWYAPSERSESEVAWIGLVRGIDARWAPEILGEDRARHLFVMPYYPPEQYPVWKRLLAQGAIDAVFAASVGAALARIHGATAGHAEIARTFANDLQFHALRIEPYLLYTAEKHPDFAERIRNIASDLAAARIALMHGDMSPKNILCGPETPMFLDAETCCYGDPAFDLAFCLNHLLLKGVWHPEHMAAYAESFAALMGSYFAGAGWEPRGDLENRTAGLLSAFLLARIDGKSPVEYITADGDKNFVRAMAGAFLRNGKLTLEEACTRWTQGLAARQ
jgi:aminoglycoside phosphotransferase (APT) family kinase protein